MGDSTFSSNDCNAYDFCSGDDDTPIKSYRSIKSHAVDSKNENILHQVLDDNDNSHNSATDNSFGVMTDSGDNTIKHELIVGETEHIIADFLDSIDILHERVTCPTEQTSDFEITQSNSEVQPEPQTEDTQKVAYIYSDELIKRCNTMMKIPMRASMIHSLIGAYGLFRYTRLVRPEAARFEDLLSFHTEDYLTFLQHISQVQDEEKYDEEAQQYGLSYDCPVQPGVYEYSTLISGATLAAAQSLLDGQSRVAINWYGGWHHAQKDSASGFCYTNDVVLGILKLREKYNKVLYVDLDLHHGDGVEDAFSMTNKVLTMSVHKYTVGFFPGTGSMDSVGSGAGKYYSVNVPLLDGIRDQEYVALTCRILAKIREKFKPDAIVCQCGADGIAGDPMKSFNLTPVALGKCVHYLLSWKMPLLLLGGGGYHHGNTARCWAYLTALTVGRKLVPDIPDHQFLMQYGPNYDLEVAIGNMKDLNSMEYLRGIYRQVMDNLSHVS